jgi:RNA polymerase sigma factor (TIGR02999 family)
MQASGHLDVTVLLAAWRSGDEQAGRELMSAVYGQLRKLAGACLRDERHPGTLQPTVLVNELYLSLFSRQPVDCESRLHFLHLATRQMRNLIVDHARRRKNQKRGGDAPKLTLDEARDHAIPVDAQLADLDEALERLEKMDQRSAGVVELRFFGGLTEQEVATLLGISVATVKRDWDFARAWLLAQLSSGEPSAPSPSPPR